MRVWGIVLLVLGLFLTLVVTIATLTTVPHGAASDLWFQLLADRLPKVFSILVSVVSALGLLVGALHGDKPEALLPFAFSLLAGLLLINQHWSVVLVLGALGLTALIRHVFVRRTVPNSNGQEPTSPI